MLRFCGYQLELVVHEVMGWREGGPAVFTATDETGDPWLVMESSRNDLDRVWLCAPVTSRVADLVRSQRAAPADALRHSRTGWVEEVRMVGGRSVADRRIACADLASAAVSGHLAAV